MRLRGTLLLGLVLLVPCAPRAQAQNYVGNGQFATDDFTDWVSGTTATSSPDSTFTPGYHAYVAQTAPDAVFGVVNSGAVGAPAMAVLGNNAGAGGPDILGETLSGLNSTNNEYKVSFSLLSSASGTFSATFNGVTIPTGVVGTSPSGWTTYSATITDTGTTGDLLFTWTDTNGSGSNTYDLTNVVVTNATPPPPTLLATLAGGAMGGLRMLRARRRRKVA